MCVLHARDALTTSLVSKITKPDYQPEEQLMTCTFTSRSVPNPHFIRLNFTVDGVATDIEDKRNKETKYKYKKEVDMHYKRLFCKMARGLLWLKKTEIKFSKKTEAT